MTSATSAVNSAMNSATGSGRDPFMPRAPKVRGRAITLAVLAHVLLVAMLALGVNWRSDEPATVAAELWSATPQAAAPRAVEPPPTRAPEPKQPEPVVKAAEPVAPPTPALPDPQIAIEKAKREASRRDQAARDEAAREKQQQARDDLAQKNAQADRLKADKEKIDKAERDKAEKADKADATRQAAVRDANLKRIAGMAGATGGLTETGTAARSSGPSASYAGRILARVKPNIVLTDPVDGNPKAVVDVRLAPDGTIIAKRLVQSSGVKVWDDAVLRAIERTEILPRDIDGRVPPQMEIGFRPRD